MKQSFGKIRISIFDKYNQPIFLAKITIKETFEEYQTGKLGECEISLPSSSFNNTNKKLENWTEYTLIIEKNGFSPHIIYGLKIIPNITIPHQSTSNSELTVLTLNIVERNKVIDVDNIRATITGLIPFNIDITDEYWSKFFKNIEINSIITNEGNTTPTVDKIAPRTPPWAVRDFSYAEE